MDSTKNVNSGQDRGFTRFASRPVLLTPDSSHIAAGSVTAPDEPGIASRIAGTSRQTSRAVQNPRKAVRPVLTDEAGKPSGLTTRVIDCRARIQQIEATSNALDLVGAIQNRQSGFTG